MPNLSSPSTQVSPALTPLAQLLRGRWALPLAVLATLGLGLLAWQNAPASGLLAGLAGAGAALPLLLALTARQGRRRTDDDARRLRDLARRDQQLRRAEQVALLGSFDWNLADDSLHWSDGHFRLWGLAPADRAPDYAAFCRSVHPDDQAAREAQLQQALQGAPYDCHYRIIRADGELRHIHSRGEVSFDAAGAARRMIGTVQDVTDWRLAEARLHTHEFVLNTIDDPVSVIDEGRVYHLVNDAWCRVTGLTREQVIGLPPGGPAQRADSPQREAALQRCLAQGQRQVTMVENELPGLGRRCWEVTVYPYRQLDRQQHGQRRSAVLVTRDVTARQAAQVALAASVDNLRLTLNATGDAIFAADALAPDQPLLFVNDRTLQMWQVPPSQAPGLTAVGLIGFARPFFVDPAREIARLNGVIDDGKPREDRLVLNDGRVMLFRCVPARGDGRWLRVWGFRDITELARAEQRLQAAEARQRSLLEAFPGYISCIDGDFRYSYVNQRLAGLLGEPPEAVVGRTVREQVGPERADALIGEIARALAGEVLTFERHHPAVDGRPEKHILITLVRGLDRDSGRHVCYSFGLDITPQKHTEAALLAAKLEAERANRAKSVFLSSMSHELRTPMNAMLGFAQLLESDPDPALSPRQRRQVREIINGGRHLLALINDLLDLARIEADSLQVQRQPVPVHPMLADCVALLAPLAVRRAIRVDSPATDDGQAVLADPTRLRQVLLNLLGNAIKYNVEGGWVRIDCRRVGRQLQVEVSDSGPGIAADLQQRLFQRFERLEAAGGPVEGTGVGLALSRRLMQLMQGEIGVHSTPGQGSRFWITLACADGGVVERASTAPMDRAAIAADAAIPAPPAAPLGSQVVQTSRRVLYIEDNPVNTLLMVAMLERVPGLVLQCAALAEEGLALALAEPPALILADIQMPGMDGYELLQQLRAQARTRHVPVIAVSANSMPQDVERGIAAGFADYLTKPLELPRLLAAVAGALAALRVKPPPLPEA